MNLPGWRWHPLKGGCWPVWVDENWRLTSSLKAKTSPKAEKSIFGHGS
jgi:hypothetical protein